VRLDEEELFVIILYISLKLIHLFYICTTFDLFKYQMQTFVLIEIKLFNLFNQLIVNNFLSNIFILSFSLLMLNIQIRMSYLQMIIKYSLLTKSVAN